MVGVKRALRWATREATAREREASARGLAAGLARALQGSTLLTAAAEADAASRPGQGEVASLFCATRFARTSNTEGFVGLMRCHYGDLPFGPEASEQSLAAIINRHSVKIES